MVAASWWNPFDWAGDQVAGLAEDGWVGIMMLVWQSGLWLLRAVMGMVDGLLTPDISANGPAREAYQIAFWVAASVMTALFVGQLLVTLVRGQARSLGRAILGSVQFVLVWSCWIGWGVLVISACEGLTHAIMESLLGIGSWADYEPVRTSVARDGTNAVLATVLGFLGLFLWVAAIGHFLLMLARAAALLVLATTTPISAAGLVMETSKDWFWKSVRWFHAAALAPVLAVLVLGLGVSITTGVAAGAPTDTQKAIGTAFSGVMMIIVSCFAPLALFRLLAFVDPGTTSGAAARAGLQSAGGLGGLMSGRGSGPSSQTASTSTAGGQSAGEQQVSEANTNRATNAFAAATGAYGKGLRLVTTVAASAAAVGADELNQSGVGSAQYYPDHERGRSQPRPAQTSPQSQPGSGGNNDGQPPPPAPHPPHMPTPQHPQPAAPTPAGGGGGAAAAEIPPVA